MPTQARLAVILLALLSAFPLAAHSQETSSERWTLVEDLRIGSLNNPEYALNAITDLAVGQEGNIYVGQFLDKSVTVFNSAGRFVRRIGREGAGPGEFQRVGPLGWKGDTLWVRDPALNRLSFFEADGSFLHSVTFSLPVPGGHGTLRPGTPMADGNLISVPSAPARLLANGTISEMPALLTDREGEVTKVLANISFEHEVAQINFDEGGMMGRQPFSDAPIWRATADGESLWIVDRSVADDADEGYFNLHRIGLSADTLVSLRYRYTPQVMSTILVDSVVDFHVERIRNGPARGAPAATAEEWVRDAFFLPSLQVPVTEVVAASDGRLWARREEPDGPTAIWNIFSESGSLMGILRAPADLEIFEASDEYVWGVREDDLDVPYIYRYRIVR